MNNARRKQLKEAQNLLDKALDIILETSIKEAEAEIDAGAHCIGIGDAVCSQIGPKFYKKFGSI